jgi:phage FluMu protein Com
MPYEMRALDVKFSRSGQFVSLAIQNHAVLESLARSILLSTPNQRDNQAELCELKKFVYRLNKTMFFDNLPLEITCSKCGKQINETVNWLKAESRKCPFCGTLIDTTEFRRGIDEATNRTHKMLRNLQESLRSIKIKIKV